jgi:hypothetical protein
MWCGGLSLGASFERFHPNAAGGGREVPGALPPLPWKGRTEEESAETKAASVSALGESLRQRA